MSPSTKSRLRSFLFLMVVLLAAVSLTSTTVAQPSPPGVGGDGFKCDWCNELNCGCEAIEECTFEYPCACSSIQCTRSCANYDCAV